ncbi:tripartite tricarboxylate transporter substrate binding protein [Bradyrhizobium yuanmingense]|uniref:Bug family tripartite tricarboxylate transporter substrate binding protein n=1 Tax=Bradyrhizobium yuanmingense TaxID=108015 RepID=UPI0023B982F1|nr:tripartite tricarboxylate transporter substrate binding protein [Bradyrhizobium yuanmingense]MDF0522023.1 tripartite tricarboxylate transporter substrate binding protein [Bradyrhizobium yuanmingense]
MLHKQGAIGRVLMILCPLLLATVDARGQSYPSRSVTIVVPFAAGGPADVVARLVAQKLQETSKQAFVIDNRSGAGGVVGTQAVSKAAPDGYTLLFVTAGHSGMSAYFSNLQFDPDRDFASVIHLISSPIVVVVNADSKYQTIQDLIADARANPGALNYGAGGGGPTIPNLTAESFRAEAKIDARNIPYRGSAPAMLGLLGGETQFSFDAMPAVKEFVDSKKMRALAVTSEKRSTILPDVPTMNEGVLPGFVSGVWYGIFVPKGTPPDVVNWLNRELNVALKEPTIVQKLAAISAEPVGGTPEAFEKLVDSETKRWGALIKRLGLKP